MWPKIAKPVIHVKIEKSFCLKIIIKQQTETRQQGIKKYV